MLKIQLKGQCTLEEVKKDYLDKVAKWSEEELSKLSTLNQGKVYDHKYESALAVIEGKVSDAAWLKGEAEIKEVDVKTLAYQVVEARKKWEKAALEIEKKRMVASLAIKASNSKSEMYHLMKKGGFF